MLDDDWQLKKIRWGRREWFYFLWYIASCMKTLQFKKNKIKPPPWEQNYLHVISVKKTVHTIFFLFEQYALLPEFLVWIFTVQDWGFPRVQWNFRLSLFPTLLSAWIRCFQVGSKWVLSLQQHAMRTTS